MRGRWFSWALATLIFVSLVVVLVHNWQALPGEISVAWQPLALASLILLGYFFLMSVIWWWLLHKLGSTLPFLQSGWLYFLNNLASYIPGKVMSVVAVAYYGGADRASQYRTGSTVVLSQVFMMLSASIFLLSAHFSGVGRAALGLMTPALVWLLGVLALLCLLALASPVLQLIANLVGRLTRARLEITPPSARTSIALTVLWFLSWFPLGVATFLFAKSLYPALGPALLPEIAVAFSASFLIGFLAFFVPGGLGIREASLALLLGQFIPSPVALLIALSSRAWVLLVTLAGTALALGIRSLHRNPAPEHAGNRA